MPSFDKIHKKIDFSRAILLFEVPCSCMGSRAIGVPDQIATGEQAKSIYLANAAKRAEGLGLEVTSGPQI